MVDVEDSIVGSREGFGDSMVDVDGVVVVLPVLFACVEGVVDDAEEEDVRAGREMIYVQMSVYERKKKDVC